MYDDLREGSYITFLVLIPAQQTEGGEKDLWCQWDNIGDKLLPSAG